LIYAYSLSGASLLDRRLPLSVPAGAGSAGEAGARHRVYATV